MAFTKLTKINNNIAMKLIGSVWRENSPNPINKFQGVCKVEAFVPPGTKKKGEGEGEVKSRRPRR